MTKRVKSKAFSQEGVSKKLRDSTGRTGGDSIYGYTGENHTYTGSNEQKL
jgi:hypothetical protein